ncbi:MAG TPA: hypothetical protein VMV83_02400 [Rectinemataceae bacterium]|nr:hypothetical protein [Rectinemataceae bacterium]
MNPTRRVALALLGADLAVYAFFFLIALLGHSGDIVISALALQWELARAGVETIRWFPAAHLFAAILAVSSLAGETEAIVVKVAAPAVVVSALVAAAALVFGPLCESTLDSTLASSGRFSAYIEKARLDLDAARLAESRTDLEVLESISAEDPRIAELERRLTGLETKAVRIAAAAKEPLPQPASAAAALRRAREYYAKGDWYNAHWQSTLALRLDPGLVEAKRLAALAWEEIARVTGSTPKDEAEATFFSEKFRGYGLLRSEDYIGAWRVFAALSKDHGSDPEVRRYLRESLAGIDRTAFYRDEADAAFARTSVPRFFLRYRDASGAERVIAALDSGFSEGVAFFKDLEYLESKPDGSALIIRAPWAKVTGGRLYLVAALRSFPGVALRATALAIAPASGEASGRAVEAPASLELGISAADLALIAEAKGDPSSLSFSDSLKTLSKTSGWGLAPEPLIADVLDRLGIPFASFGTAIVGLLLGLRFRPASPEIKRGFSLVSVPIIAALVIGAWRLIDRLDVVSSLWASRAVPAPDALWLSSGMRLLFILAGVILVAGATRPEGSAIDEGSPSEDE